MWNWGGIESSEEGTGGSRFIFAVLGGSRSCEVGVSEELCIVSLLAR